MAGRRRVWRVLGALAAIGYGAAVWEVTDRFREEGLLPTEEHVPDYDQARVVGVRPGEVVLEPGPTARPNLYRDGRFGLRWPGGFGQMDGLLDRHHERVRRPLRVLRGLPPVPGEHVAVDPFFYEGDPTSALGLAHEDVTYPTELGEFPAWYVPGAADTWAIFVHGKGVHRGEALRLLPTMADLGLPSFVISYRNDPEARPDPVGLHRFGTAEWRDVEDAIRYALHAGARDVVLVGYSMGGAIVGNVLLRSPLASRVRGAILDSPLLHLLRTVRFGAEQAGHPRWLIDPAVLVAGLRFGVDWSETDLLSKAAAFDTPMLLFHGDEDDAVPVETSLEFEASRPDLVELVRWPDVGHVDGWNLHPVDYEAAVRTFLRSVLPQLQDEERTAG